MNKETNFAENLEEVSILEESIQPGGMVCGLSCLGGACCGALCFKG